MRWIASRSTLRRSDALTFPFLNERTFTRTHFVKGDFTSTVPRDFTPSFGELFSAELRTEAETTRRFIERIPAGKLTWRPHEKSHTAGELALHIAQIPDGVSMMAMSSPFSMDKGPPEFTQPKTIAEILHAHAQGVEQALSRLSGISDDAYLSDWTLTIGGKPIMTMPRHVMVRSILLNQTYHHRGQLGVYLRLMGENVPWSYGPSADEMPPGFEEM